MTLPVIKKIMDRFHRKQVKKTISSYQEILESNPRDTRTRVKLADVYVKEGNIAEAVTQYIASAEILAEAGFQLKSISLYKQVVKLDPESVHAYRRLAQLASQHGLLADAYDYYASLAKCLHKQHTGKDQTDLFEGIAKLNLESLQTKLDVAEAIFAEPSRERDVLSHVCAKLQDISRDSTIMGDVATIAEWMSSRYPTRDEVNDLVATIGQKKTERGEPENAAAEPRIHLAAETVTSLPKADVPTEARVQPFMPRAEAELLTQPGVAENSSLEDQVKIKLETNIYDILKKRADKRHLIDKDTLAGDKVEFDELFKDFKRDLQEKVERGDHETHFNLGIAYREMGLHADAIREFEVALEDPDLCYDCCFFMGQSYMDLDQPEKAIIAYEKGVAIQGLSLEKAFGMKYELAVALSRVGRKEEALKHFNEIYRLKKDYRDVVEYLKKL